MQEMYCAFMRSGKPSKMSEALFMQGGTQMMRGDMVAKRVCVTDETRVSFFVAFGVTPDEQTAMEDYYRGWTVNHEIQHVDDIGCIGGSPM